MLITDKPIRVVTARDLMTQPVEVIPQTMSLRSAARLLVRSDITGAPVVDDNGRCVGVLSASDFLRWTEEGAVGAEDGPIRACPYQEKGRLVTGGEAMICRLASDGCRWQDSCPTTGGRHTTVCKLPDGVLSDWQKLSKNMPRGAVRRYMSTDVVTVRPDAGISELARTMVEAYIHRVIVVDEEHKPVGIITSMDLLDALGREDMSLPA